MLKNIRYVNNPNLESLKADFPGNIMLGKSYYQDMGKSQLSLHLVLKWWLSKNPQKKEKCLDDFKLSVVQDYGFKQSKEDIIVWLGHASFFIRIAGVTFITDPAFFNLLTNKRLVAMPYQVAELGNIDYVLISHVHYDHFDVKSLALIAKHNPAVEILGPLGIGNLIKSKYRLKHIKYQQAGWYQLFNNDKNIEIAFLPAKHWNRRSAIDFNQVLWGSFAIKSIKHKLYFAGDTAYQPSLFEQIQSIYKSFDICLLPIGAYSPSYLMELSHINPAQALEIFKILKGKVLVPMHYGSFDLSNEPMGEPLRWLQQMAKQMALSNAICPVDVGSSHQFDALLANMKL